MWTLYLLLFVLSVWLVGDWGYSRYVARRIAAWESSVTWRDGVREGCEAFEMGPADSSRAILLVHGLNDSPACFRELAPVFAKAGLFCRAIRLEGFGMSTADYAQGDREAWLEQIEEGLKSLRAKHQRVYLAAHSLGGALSVRHLIDNPSAADKVVLIAPGIAVSNSRSPVLSTRAWHNISNVLLRSTKVTASPFGLDATRVTDADYPFRTSFTPRVIFDQSFAVIDSLKGTEPQFTTPVLLAISRKDIVIDSDAAKRYIDNCGATVKEIAYFDESGHALLVDHTAPALAERMVKFLSE